MIENIEVPPSNLFKTFSVNGLRSVNIFSGKPVTAITYLFWELTLRTGYSHPGLDRLDVDRTGRSQFQLERLDIDSIREEAHEILREIDRSMYPERTNSLLKLLARGGVELRYVFPIGVIRIGRLILQIAYDSVLGKKGVFPRPGGVILDCIECGLHHTVMDIVFTGITEMARRLDVQLFFTSHSMEFIRSAFQANIQHGVTNLAYFRLENPKPREIRVVGYTDENLETSINAFAWEIR